MDFWHNFIKQFSKFDINSGLVGLDDYFVILRFIPEQFLEDDTILVENFMPILESRIGTLSDEKSKWDFLFIGSCCNLRISQEHIIPGQYWYKKSYPATKCADSYVIKRKAAQACLEELPYTLPIDWELSYIIEKRNMTTYWLEPPIVVQGSQNGTYESSIQCSM